MATIVSISDWTAVLVEKKFKIQDIIRNMSEEISFITLILQMFHSYTDPLLLLKMAVFLHYKIVPHNV